MKKPLNKKQGFLLLEFVEEKFLNDFLAKEKIHVWGRNILVSPYLTGEARRKKKESLKQRRLFIKEIPPTWNTQKLMEEFSKLGEIQQAYIVDKPKKSKLTKDYKESQRIG